MKSKDQIKSELAQFTGTEEYHRFSPLFRNVLLTDGALYLAEECGAYWFMDVIASHLPSVTEDHFAVAILTKTEGDKAFFTLQDDVPFKAMFAHQSIEFTDFPLDEIKLYVIRDGGHWVILLPSEY